MHDAVITTARAAFGKKPVERNQLPMPLGLWAFEPVFGAAADGANPFDTGWDDGEWPKRAVWAFKRRNSPYPTSMTSAFHAWTALVAHEVSTPRTGMGATRRWASRAPMPQMGQQRGSSSSSSSAGGAGASTFRIARMAASFFFLCVLARKP